MHKHNVSIFHWCFFVCFFQKESKQIDIHCQTVHLTLVLSSFLWKPILNPNLSNLPEKLQLQSYHLAKGASFKISSPAIIFNMLSIANHTTWTHRSSLFSQHQNSPSTVDTLLVPSFYLCYHPSSSSPCLHFRCRHLRNQHSLLIFATTRAWTLSCPSGWARVRLTLCSNQE